MNKLTNAQKSLILRIFNLREGHQNSEDEEQSLLATGIDYNDVLIDNDDGIHIPGYENDTLI